MRWTWEHSTMLCTRYPAKLTSFDFFLKTSILLLSGPVLKEAIVFILQGEKSFDTTELA